MVKEQVPMVQQQQIKINVKARNHPFHQQCGILKHVAVTKLEKLCLNCEEIILKNVHQVVPFHKSEN